MRYGIAFDGRVPVAETLALAQAAEAHGFECAWVSEHLGHREPFEIGRASCRERV